MARTAKLGDRAPLPVALDVWGVSSPQPRGLVTLKRQYARACAALARAGELKVCYAGADTDRKWLVAERLLESDGVFRWFRIPGRLQRALTYVPFVPLKRLLAGSYLYHSCGAYSFDAGDTRVVGTLVDFVPMRVPQFVPLPFTSKQVRWCKWAAGRCDSKWIAISEQVRQDALELARLREDQVEVVKLCVDRDMFCTPAGELVASTLKRLGIRQPYVLSVNTLNPRKNHERLLSAWDQGSFSGQGWTLVLVGHAAESPLADRLDSGQFRGVKWLGYLRRDLLVHLYYACEIFAYPSFYEGFGIPVAEAVVAGRAILTSHRSAMAEVAGGGAIYVDPWDTASIVRGLSEMVGNKSLRRRLGAYNETQREKFSLERLTVDLLEAYRRILN